MLFEPLTTTLITIVKDLIRTAILYFEPRIDLLSVSIDTRDALAGQVLIELSYLVRSTNSRFNFVYPFYLEEASSQPTS
jgi:phage baseplate assembly protein W